MIPKPKAKPKKKAPLKRKNRLTKSTQKTVVLNKHTPVKNNKVQKMHIVEFHPVPKPGTRNGIKMVSQHQRERERNLQKLKHYLIKVRANGMCEICGNPRDLAAAHIIERAECGKDNAGNIIIACSGIGGCHDHASYVHGLPVEPQELLRIIAEKNRERGIDRFMTGETVPAEGEWNENY